MDAGAGEEGLFVGLEKGSRGAGRGDELGANGVWLGLEGGRTADLRAEVKVPTVGDGQLERGMGGHGGLVMLDNGTA